ncbi:MAG TPA: hypothetical protein VGI84_11510 [Pseudonocardiaceae bacterium]|jgi:hypothetical protein
MSEASSRTSQPVAPQSGAPHGRFDWPWRGGLAFVSPDGRQLSLGGRAADDLDAAACATPWSGAFFALVNGSRRSFTVAEQGAFDWHSRYTTIHDQVFRRPFRGGELTLGTRADPAEYRAAWRGHWFELHTRNAGPHPAADTMLRTFDAFRFTETPLGMLLAPRSTRQLRMEPVRVAKQIPGIGHLTIERPGTSQVAVPDFGGYRTAHGEMWRQPLGAGAQGRARSDLLVLATPTAVTRLMPGPAGVDTADPNTAMAFLAGLNVTWEHP